MPSLITHLCITNKLKEIYKFNSEVLLGSIMPDILKNTKLKTKEESHYIDEGNIYPNIDKYISENIKKNYSNINLGYLLHLIQDNIWEKCLRKLEELFEDTHEEFATRIYSDMNYCDKYILEKLNITSKDFKKLKIEMKNLTSNPKIKLGIDKSLKIRKIDSNQIYFVTTSILEEYLEKSLNECQKYLKPIIGDKKENYNEF